VAGVWNHGKGKRKRCGFQQTNIPMDVVKYSFRKWNRTFDSGTPLFGEEPAATNPLEWSYLPPEVQFMV
jgi:hypothetical protein